VEGIAQMLVDPGTTSKTIQVIKGILIINTKKWWMVKFGKDEAIHPHRKLE
jgi:hypothetical protein